MIQVIRCGHDSRHTKPLDMIYRRGIDHFLLLLFKTGAYVEQNGVLLDVPPQTAILFCPEQRIHYGCRHSDFNDDWIHFSVTGDDPVLSGSGEFSPVFGVPFQPSDFPDLSRYTRLVASEFRQACAGSRSQDILNALMHALLWKLQSPSVSAPESVNPYYPVLSRLRAELYNAPAETWDTAETAGRLHLSPSYFQHLYKDLFGTPFRRDVILARLEASRYYLEETPLDISSVASLCGYENPLHFMRQFKKFLGITPSQYRIRAGSLPNNPDPKTEHLKNPHFHL